MPLTTTELCDILPVIVDLAKEAGRVIRKAYDHGKSADTKEGNSTDLVTETDQEVEKLIFGRLRVTYPKHGFIGEESVAAGEKAILTDKPTWIVDPIDGTTNFVHGYPFVCVSIALVETQRSVLGVIYNPILDELYTAITGKGAFMNDKALPLRSPSPVPTLDKALVSAEFGSDRSEAAMKVKLEGMNGLTAASAGAAHGLRAIGSAAMNLCLVARGSSDVYWECGVHVWDVAAGILILQEAGGRVFHGAGHRSRPGAPLEPLDLMARKFLAIRGGDSPSATKAQEALAMQVLQYLDDYPIPRDNA